MRTVNLFKVTVKFSKIKKRDKFLQNLLRTRLVDIRNRFNSIKNQKGAQKDLAYLHGKAEAYREVYDILVGDIEIGIPVDD